MTVDELQDETREQSVSFTPKLLVVIQLLLDFYLPSLPFVRHVALASSFLEKK
jgi:hypothetical protein